MSRSFHVTKKQVESSRIKVSDGGRGANETYERLRDRYETKHLTKRYVKRERNKNLQFPVPGVIDALPIEYRRESSFVHYPVTAQDIRELLKIMPQGVTDGLSKILFCLAKQYQRYPDESLFGSPEPDPYTGRLGYKFFSDVYCGRCLGTYFSYRREIRVYGYVYPDDIPLREVVEFFLRMQMLMVFLHELAHHHDRQQRTARGRWRMDKTESAEIYAEQTAHEWIEVYAIPYICQRYADEYARLKKWMKQTAGVCLDLRLLAGDYRDTARKGRIRISSFFNTADYFAEFAARIQNGEDSISARVELASDLHMADEYDISLKILQTALAKNLRNVRALCVCADIYWHLNEYVKAVKYARKAMSLDKKEVDAYKTLCDAYEGLEQWDAVIKWACGGLEHAQTKWEAMLLLQSKARAEIALRQFKEAKDTLQEIKALFSKRVPRHVKELESELKRKQQEDSLC